jgi:hypothetical protein
VRPDILDRLRRFLNLSPDSFIRQLEPVDSDSNLDDDDEMRLLASFRKLSEDRKSQLLRFCGRLLADTKPMTLTYKR